MKNINLTVDQDTLLLICNSLSQLHKVEAFASEAHRRISLDIRYKLGPRLFRAALKVPCPKFVKLGYLEATVIDFALSNYECDEHETFYARQILGQIQPGLIDYKITSE